MKKLPLLTGVLFSFVGILSGCIHLPFSQVSEENRSSASKCKEYDTQESGLFSTPQSRLSSQSILKNTLRCRFVSIDWDELETYPDTITLNLFDDTTLIVEGRILSQESQSNYSWHGYVLGEESSEVSLAIRGKTLTGGIHTQDKLYQIRPAGGGLHIIGDIDWRSLPREGHPVFLPPK